MARIEWRMLEVGHCVHPECSAVRGGRWRLCEFPSLVALLRHPSRGWVLFDTGYSQRFFDATAAFPASLYRWVTPVKFDPRKALVTQLRELGVPTEEIAAIVLSHFHADHVAGVLDFPGVKVYCSREGWAALHARPRLAALRQGLLEDLAPMRDEVCFIEDAGAPGVRTSVAQATRPETSGGSAPGARMPAAAALAAGTSGFSEHDLLGDGSLIAVGLPGHSPGHHGLRFIAEDDREVMLIGDAAWSTRAIRENRPPPAWATAWLGNTQRYRDTLSRLHNLARERPDTAFVPSHCTEWRP